MRIAIATGLVLLGGGALMFLQAHDFDDREHTEFQDALWRTKHLDTSFKEHLLRARFSLLNTYDDFEDNRRQSELDLQRMTRIPAFVPPTVRTEIAAAVDTHVRLLEQRHTLVERFKSQNAVVTNSRHYLPVAVDALNAQLRTNETDRELATAVNRVMRGLFAGPSTSESLPARIDALRAWIAAHPDHPQIQHVVGIERHASMLMLGTVRINTLVAEILALPTLDGIEALFHVYEAEVARALSRVRHYRLMLYAAIAAMLAGIGHVLWAQRSTNRRLERRVDERTRDLAASEQRFRTLTEAAPIGIFLTDEAGAAVYLNPHWLEIAGLCAGAALGKGWMDAVHPDDIAALATEWEQAAREGCALDREFRFQTPLGVRSVHARTVAVRGDGGAVLGHVGTVEDITERKRIAAELQQAQKLESVGRLAAGVAHEINTPVQYVNDSCFFLRDGIQDLHQLIVRYREVLQAVADGSVDARQALALQCEHDMAADIDYLLGHMPIAIDSAMEGLQRVAVIVRSMKEFAHPDQSEMTHADINRAIESTLTIARNEYKYVADVKTELGDLPPVPCFLGDLNQVVLNIVVNAAHAIGEVVGNSSERGLITVRTARDGDAIAIAIADTGPGIPEHIRSRIFDPFFTTKEVGKGTGQGLALARSVVVDKHRGSLDVETQVGRGTTFTIRIPAAIDEPLEIHA